MLFEVKEKSRTTRMMVCGKQKLLSECSQLDLLWLWENKPNPERFIICIEPPPKKVKKKLTPI